MRLLFLLLCSIAFCSAELNVADIFQKFLEVENALKEQWKNDFLTYRQNKESAAANLNASITAVENEFKRKAEELKTAFEEIRSAKQAKKAEEDQRRQEVIDELRKAFDGISASKQWEKEEEKRQLDELMKNLGEKWQERVKEKQEEKRQEIEDFKAALAQMKQRWDEFRAQVEKAKEVAAEKKEQQKEKLKQTLEDLKTLMKDEQAKRDEAKRERQAKFNETMNEYREDIQEKRDEIEAMEAEVMSRLEAIKAKKQEMSSLIRSALGEGVKNKMMEKMNDKLQRDLDKAAAIETIKGQSQGGQGAAVDTRATVLDEITGTSQWQTVTWILLALSILLTVALIAMILFQLSQRKHYQRLEGHDDTERAPLAKAGPVGKLSYTEAPSGSAPKSILAKNSQAGYKPEMGTAPEEDPVI